MPTTTKLKTKRATTKKTNRIKTTTKDKASSKTSKSKNTKLFIFRHKLLIILSTILFLVVLSLANQKYQDWDNARMIKGLAKDFPVLVDQINQATGLNLKPKVNCSTTQEKFGGGVSTCELSIVSVKSDKITNIAKKTIIDSTFIKSVSLSDNKQGYKIVLPDNHSCMLSNKKTIYFTCITAVRDANTKLALDVFFPKK